MKRLLSVLLIFIAAFALSAVNVCAEDKVNGISVSSDRLLRGEEFTVTLYAPPAENADTASIQTEFDGTAFEVVKWEAVLPGLSFTNSGDGFFSASSSNVERAIDLSDGLELSAVLRVKDTADPGEYELELKKYSLCYVDDSGYDFVEIWEPDTFSVKVTVSEDGGSALPEEIEEAENAKTQQPVGDDAEESENTDAPVKDSDNNMTRIMMIAGAAVLLAGLCFAAVRFGTGRK